MVVVPLTPLRRPGAASPAPCEPSHSALSHRMASTPSITQDCRVDSSAQTCHWLTCKWWWVNCAVFINKEEHINFIKSFSTSNMNISVVFNQVVTSEFIPVSWASEWSWAAARERLGCRAGGLGQRQHHALLWAPLAPESLSSYILLFPKDWVSDLGNLLFPNFPNNILSGAWYSFY